VVKFAKRALESAVLLFALYAFAKVPLGRATGLEHLKAILGTSEAQEAGREMKQAGSRLLGELLEFDNGQVRGVPKLPKELLSTQAPSLAHSSELRASVTGVPASEAASADEAREGMATDPTKGERAAEVSD
jgi:hypothetical protein